MTYTSLPLSPPGSSSSPWRGTRGLQGGEKDLVPGPPITGAIARGLEDLAPEPPITGVIARGLEGGEEDLAPRSPSPESVIIEAEQSLRVSKHEIICPECHKKIGNRNLARHIKDNHSNTKKFTCQLCGAKYKRNESLKKHVGHGCRNDPAIYPIECEKKCEKRFKNNEAMKNHIKRKVCSKEQEISQRGGKKGKKGQEREKSKDQEATTKESLSPENVRETINGGGIYLALPWVTACLEFLAQESPHLNGDRLVAEVLKQWEFTDITKSRVMEKPVLPSYISTLKSHQLKGSFVLMVVTPSDLSQDIDSCSILSDGFSTVKALETRPLPKPLCSGNKVLLRGPLTAHKGLILISPEQVQVIGGEEKQVDKEQVDKEQVDKEQVEEVEETLYCEESESEQCQGEQSEREKSEREQFNSEQMSMEHIDSEQLDSEKIDNAKLNRELFDSEQFDNEQFDNERLDSEQLDSEQLDSEQLDSEQFDSEQLDSEQMVSEQLDWGQSEEEKDRKSHESDDEQRVRKPRVSFSQEVTVYWEDDDGGACQEVAMMKDDNSSRTHGGGDDLENWRLRQGRKEQESDVGLEHEDDSDDSEELGGGEASEDIIVEEVPFPEAGEDIIVEEVAVNVSIDIEGVAKVIDIGDIDNFINHMEIILK